MATEDRTIGQQITRIENAKTNIINSIRSKGVSVPSDALIDAMPGYINSIDTNYITYRTGSSVPSSSLGQDGDIYLRY